MKLTQRFAAILSAILACLVGGGLLVLPAENAQALIQSPVPKTGLTYAIPVNPNIVSNPETNFGAFAWQAFVALNWPADCKGVPLKEKTIGEAPNNPRVWEFYQFPEDVFTRDGAKPELQPIVPPQCAVSKDNQSVAQDLRLTEFASEPTFQPDQLELNRKLSILVPGNKPLIDRAGNYILNEIRMNPVEVNQIVENGWYSPENLKDFNNENNLFQLMCSALQPQGIYPYPPFDRVPCSDNTSMGTIELKAAWKVLQDPVPDELRSTYYTTTRTFDVQTPDNVNGEKTEVTVPVGLVGFHIIQKTSQQGWIWATFEHIKNAPDAKNLPESGDYNLYSSDCQENCTANKPFAKKPYLWGKEFPYAVTQTEGGEIVKQIPSQITRLVSIPDIAQSLNSKWKAKLAAVPNASVWQNYQLIGVQWLDNPYIPYDLNERRLIPAQLANVTLEPYVQKTELGSSCIACHTNAWLPSSKVHADFSFLMNNNQSLGSVRK
ncbi:MAG TPA: hypothetical protein DEG17_08740 [Cyanobacteria bacterium UBA11149]|nr:hypothetical protein [Cyanobacteria bacterium UBA11367]HBE56984.1 hypothetical protein [Cyanobacteria bacterium UBA11366]HBK63505.1 hypothetical protein [Cyanobacteria bacterium UBA11166]HBR75973.1 hypothetical protein [Cyanobacteria bacterium UBA11159]HBS71392.1 hypothetical protein [Cyanobacteria bacterium UBA11153]HBW88943.1 hypothetical protein [Cyanobacteria bacterium UBA11149]HCA95677.1 hypothetical protein [Cyanobacteria bacterium UBA9226]